MKEGIYRDGYNRLGAEARQYQEAGYVVLSLENNLKRGDRIKSLSPASLVGRFAGRVSDIGLSDFLTTAKRTVLVLNSNFFEPSHVQYPEHRIRDLGFTWHTRRDPEDKRNLGPIYIMINDLGEVIDLKQE